MTTESATEVETQISGKEGEAKPVSAKKKATKGTKAAKKPAKKTEAKAPAAKKSGGVKWSDQRIALVKALRALKAFDLSSAQSAAKLAAKSGLSEQEVKHYGYHAQQLAMNGVTRVDRIEGEGLGYYLTAKGKTVEMA